MPATELSYQSQPPLWRRILICLQKILVPSAQHTLALLTTIAILIVIPTIAFTLIYFALWLYALFTHDDMGSILFLPVGLLFIFIAGGGATLFTFLLNLTVDFIRRPLRWPILASPLICFAGTWPVMLVLLLGQGTFDLRLLFIPPLLALAVTCLFCVYWIPLALSHPLFKVLAFIWNKITNRSSSQ